MAMVTLGVVDIRARWLSHGYAIGISFGIDLEVLLATLPVRDRSFVIH
jgi:hypothetical protein